MAPHPTAFAFKLEASNWTNKNGFEIHGLWLGLFEVCLFVF